MSDSSKPATERSSEDRQLAEELVERARSEGVDLVGPDGLQYRPCLLSHEEFGHFGCDGDAGHSGRS